MSQGRFGVTMQEWSSQLTQIRWQRWLQRLPRWLTILFIVLLAKVLADLTWMVFAPSASATARPVAATLDNSGQTTTTPRLRALVQQHLFGIAREAAPPKDEPIEAKETGLRLTLRGTIAASEDHQAMAVIADAKGDEKVYLRGDTIVAGATLYAIYPDRVILERNGNFETLSLPRDEIPEGAVATHPAAEADVPTRTVTANERLRELRQELTSDPQKVLQQVRIEPVLGEDNQIKGYRLSHNDPRVMQALGLRPDDVVTSVNGLPLDDPTVLYGILNELNSQQDLRLSVERNGQTQMLVIRM